MLAVIKTGGKQHLVSPGDIIKIEKIEAEEGKETVFDQILLLTKEEAVEIGSPLIKGAQVKGKVIEHGKGKKEVIFKYKSKKRYKKKKGHRQPYTKIEITKIISPASSK